MTKINRLFPFALSIILALAFSVATVAQQPARATPKPETVKQYNKDGSEVHRCGAPTKDGREIIGTYEMTPGCALVTAIEDGEIDYDGETKMYWDGQQTQTENGQRIWIDDNGDEVLESEIVWKDADA